MEQRTDEVNGPNTTESLTPFPGGRKLPGNIHSTAMELRDITPTTNWVYAIHNDRVVQMGGMGWNYYDGWGMDGLDINYIDHRNGASTGTIQNLFCHPTRDRLCAILESGILVMLNDDQDWVAYH